MEVLRVISLEQSTDMADAVLRTSASNGDECEHCLCLASDG